MSSAKVAALFDMMRLSNATNSNIDTYAKNPQTKDMAPIFRKFLQKHMGWESIKDDMTKMYMEAFTAQEVEDMIAFYKTPTGKKLIEKQPELQRKAMEIGQQRVQANMAELQQMLRDAAEERKQAQKYPINPLSWESRFYGAFIVSRPQIAQIRTDPRAHHDGLPFARQHSKRYTVP